MDNDTMAYQVNQCILVDVIEIERTSADWDCAWLSELRDDSQRVRVYMTDCNDGYIEVLQSGDYLVTAPRAQLHTADLLTAEKFLFEEWLLV